jgi:hypothetical protein
MDLANFCRITSSGYGKSFWPCRVLASRSDSPQLPCDFELLLLTAGYYRCLIVVDPWSTSASLMRLSAAHVLVGSRALCAGKHAVAAAAAILRAICTESNSVPQPALNVSSRNSKAKHSCHAVKLAHHHNRVLSRPQVLPQRRSVDTAPRW